MALTPSFGEDLSGIAVAVVGDPIADLYVTGRPEGVSREAPVLVVTCESERLLAGGAANTANNLLAIGAPVVFAGAAGDDANGRGVRALLSGAGADVNALLLQEGGRTAAKMRVLAGDAHRTKQHIVKVSYEPTRAAGPDERARMRDRLESRRGALRAVVLSDYGYGSFGEPILGWARSLRGIPVVADSRYRLPECAGFTAVTPNEEEAAALLGRPVEGTDEATRAAEDLRERLGTRMVLLTRGNEGMVLSVQGAPPLALPITGPAASADVSGAGDTVTAIFALSLAAGATPDAAARLSNAAAGVVVAKPGVATLTREEWRRIARAEAARG